MHSIGAFPNSLNEKHALSSWVTLLLFGLLFIGYFTYLFLKAQGERAEHEKMDQSNEQNGSANKEGLAETKLLEITEGLIKLFNLRKRGFISEQEFNRLKEKLYQNGSVG